MSKAGSPPGSGLRCVLALQLQIRQAVAKRVIFEHRSGAYFNVREHRSTGNYSLQPGIMKNATVVLEIGQRHDFRRAAKNDPDVPARCGARMALLKIDDDIVIVQYHTVQRIDGLVDRLLGAKQNPICIG